MDRGPSQATVHGIAKSQTRLSDFQKRCFIVHSTIFVVVQFSSVQFSLVQFSHSVESYSLQPYGLQHAGLPVHHQLLEFSNSCPLSRWQHTNISSSVIPFSSRLQSSPASDSFQMSKLFTSGGQSLGASASASVLPKNIQD